MPRGRQPRATEERRERRMKAGGVQADGRKLLVNEDALDRENYEYRFVADRGGRVQSLHNQDWDIVTDETVKEDSNSVSSTRTVHGGTEESGQGYKMVLMRKHKDWYEDDQQVKQKPLSEIEEQLTRNDAQSVAAKYDRDEAHAAYTPGSGNSMNVTQGYKP